ncbi:MAG TPA: glycoside hydrolase family 16 protein, partial [Chitinophagaceae bacterium]|nr:glycoside hydrolase family 16 protein [Chitinophagaceae bacterium]
IKFSLLLLIMNHYKRFLPLLFLFYCIALFAGCAASKKNTAVRDNQQVVFFDDFSGSSIDRTKWNVRVTGGTVNNEQQAYVDSAATVYIAHGAAAEGAENGALILQPHFSPGFITKEGKSFDFISGRIDTRNKVDFTYGTASARIKLTAGSGLWPAWWMLGAGRWPDAGEIDIMEYTGEKDWASAAVHGPGYSGETPFVNRLYFAEDNDVTNWHIYSVDWTADSLVFKYDGIQMFRTTRPMVEHFGKWSFNNAKFLILNFALGGAYPAKINGVKEPYNGITLSTIESIKNNQSKMLVDWVRITKKQ